MLGSFACWALALLYACVGSDPDASTVLPDASTSSSGSTSGGGSSSGSGGSSSSGNVTDAGTDAGPTCTSDEELCNGACLAKSAKATSKDHCGACGHSCGGGDCKLAVCGPALVVADILDERGYDVMDGYVYFVTNDDPHTKSDVFRCSVSGCAPAEQLYSATANGTSISDLHATGGVIAFHGNRVGSSGGGIKICPATGCLGNDIGGNGYRHIYAATKGRFFLSGGRNDSPIQMIECHPSDAGDAGDPGCTQTKLVDEGSGTVGYPQRGGADGTHLTYGRSNLDGGTELVLCDPNTGCDGGTVVVTDAPTANIISGGKLLLMTSGSESQPTGNIRQCDLPCTTPPSDLVPSTQYPVEIVADEKDLYWLSPAYDAILTCPLTGCPAGPKEVLTGLGNHPSELRVDEGFVYWSSESPSDDSGLHRDIRRVAKPLAPK